MVPDKPFSQACENNKGPILTVLERVFSQSNTVLEIGSGTGQHAVFFATHLPHLQWQPSDRPENLSGINAWRNEARLENLLPPLQLDVTNEPWPVVEMDGIFSANTLHIMGWPEVEGFFAGVGRRLTDQGYLCIYGPFNYGGRYTSDSNAQFDQWLKQRDPRSAIRDQEAVCELAARYGLQLLEDNAMPANNRLLVWRKLP